MLAAVHQLREPLRAKPGHEVVAVGDHGNPGATAQQAPLSQGFNVLCDVELIELTVVLLEPILGICTVGSRRGRVNFDPGHGGLLEGWDVGRLMPGEDAAGCRPSRVLVLGHYLRGR